ERPDDDVHRRGKQRVSECAQLPVAEVGRREEHAAACAESAFKVFAAFQADPAREGAPMDRRALGERHEGTRDGAEYTIDHGLRWCFRERHREVPTGDTTEPGNRTVQEANIEAGERVRHSERGVL